MSGSSFAHRLAVRSALPRLSAGARDVVNIGFLGPMSGPVQSWGLPGLNGARIWEDWLNAAGGLLIDGQRHPVRIHAFDCGYDPDHSMEGARLMVQRHNVALLMMLGGDTFTPVRDFLMRSKVLTSTLLPSDLSPDTPLLIAPSELHPIYNVTSIDWLARTRPTLKTAAICSQTDALGLPSLATYRAAFKAAGIDLVKEIQYPPDQTDAAAIVDAMLEEAPDILCWSTSYTPMVHALTEYAHAKGFDGQIVSCTLDNYPALVAHTSAAFMEGTVFQFPDFDDPMLREKAFFFHQPDKFFEEYQRRFPDSWSAVSWEYVATLEIWQAAVEKAGSLAPGSVLAAMKQSGQVTHAFGPAQWWGDAMFGISNALVGDWPVVTVQDGKARITEFGSIPAWLKRHESLLRSEMSDLGQLWEQRLTKGGWAFGGG
ncbi:ABC transporter substrate-binding protein [Roseovarius dicentrarchi]|uniref:ABC transporter substrate-binding protein n=1 Tax=Roseovarius dicentrarchi TaxID=2250573 RepID=UPI000DEBCB57|nr:ABC transporter substrate-binding protein [Roseovarius dicentrarchi]